MTTPAALARRRLARAKRSKRVLAKRRCCECRGPMTDRKNPNSLTCSRLCAKRKGNRAYRERRAKGTVGNAIQTKGKACRTCIGQSWRVEGKRCRECGLKYAPEPLLERQPVIGSALGAALSRGGYA